MVNKLRIYFTWMMIAGLSLGFRTMGGARWDITPERPTIWLNIDAGIRSAVFSETKFPDGTDPLKDTPKEQQVLEILKMVIDDFNSVPTSYIRLQSYPGQLPEYDGREGDMAYDEEYAATHTIHIVVNDPSGASSGDASPSVTGNKINNCRIRTRASAIKDAARTKTLLTHEIFHCLGFGHEHEDRESVMSYDAHEVIKLGLEEHMGLTHLYPKDPSYGQEQATFGMACKPQ